MVKIRLRPGDVFLDDFVIEEKLGTGKYGQVFKARDLSDDTRVALKVSYDKNWTMEKTAVEARILEMFQNSDTSGRQLVVNMKAYFELDDCIALVLELLGTNLLDAIKADFFCSYSKLSTIARQSFQFLKTMRQLNVIHGDIKPENMLLQRDKADKIKFVDFGLSHAPFLQNKNSLIQATCFRSPEVVMGYDYNHSADTWSLGCTLFECLTKTPLFDVDNEFQLLDEITTIIGPLSQAFIEKAPERDQYYHYDIAEESWLLNSIEVPSIPMGLRRLIKETCKNIDVEHPECVSFIELVEGMLRLEPCKRYGPQKCLAHPFITAYLGSRELSDANMDEIAHMCFEMGINKDVMEKALNAYEEIGWNTASKEENKMAIFISCLHNECRRRKIFAKIENFALFLGIDVGHLARLEEIVKQIQGDGGEKGNTDQLAINDIPMYCSQLGLNAIVARNATVIAKRTIEKDATCSANLYSIVAAAIFIAAVKRGSKRKVKAIATVTGAPEAAVRRILKKMFPLARSFSAEKYKK